MKTKGVSVIETMIEKIVLAVALVIFLAVFAIQFLGTPTVDLPGGMGEVPIDQATDAVASAARTKIDQLESVGGVDNVPEPVDLSGELIARFTGPVAEPVQIAGLVPEWPPLEGIGADVPQIDPTGENIYAVPTPVAPSTPVAAVLTGTVDPSVPLLYPEAAALLPEEQPMDKAFVSVQSDWDAAANRARISAQTTGEGELTLPQSWRETMEIWDVELVRRELGSDGSWGPESVVPPMPGRPSLRDRLDGATPPDISVLESEERSLRAGIRQPRMYNLIAGDYWMAPALIEQAETVERPAEVERLLRRVRSLRSEIETIERRLENLDGGGRSSLIRPAPDRFFDIDAIDPGNIQWPEFPDSARAQAGGGGGGGGGDRPPREDPIEAQRRALQERLSRRQAELQQAIDRLLELGYDDEGNLIADDEEQAPDFADSATVSATDPEAGNITVWAHDLTAEPGMTYQYAVRVKLRNPLFGNAGSVGEAQSELAENAVIASGLSEWSEAVVVPNLSEFFVVSASGGSTGLTMGTGPTANAEVFRYFYGAWRQQTVRLNAGDSVRASIDLPDNLPLYTLEKPDGEPVELVEEGVLTTEMLDFSRDVFLLDVVSGVEDFITAYFRGDQGGVIAHLPAADRASEMLARMRISATGASEQEFRPLDLTDSTTPGRPDRPNPGDQPDAPDGPGAPSGPGAPAGPGSPFG